VRLAPLDWAIVAVSLLISFVPAVLLARRAGASTAEFFTSGRAAPWWLIGVSMVATTFSTDTPNLVTNLVRENGVAQNWAWWAFELMMSIGAGTGLIYLLRWFWWRINAWSEIAAMIGSFLVAVGFALAPRWGISVPTHLVLVSSVAITTVVWITVTLLTEPTDRRTLIAFYARVRPAGPGWRPIRAETGLGPSPDSLARAAASSVLGCALVYAALFGSGSLLYGKLPQASGWLLVFVASAAGLRRIAPRQAECEITGART